MKYVSVILIIICIACSKQIINKNEIVLESISSIGLNEKVDKIIKDFIAKNNTKQFFVINFYQIYPDRVSFFLSPVYSTSDFVKGKPLICLKIENKKVFINCGMERLLSTYFKRDSSFFKKLNVDNDIKYDDWTLLPPGAFIDPIIIYITVFNNDSVVVSNRLDTISGIGYKNAGSIDAPDFEINDLDIIKYKNSK